MNKDDIFEIEFEVRDYEIDLQGIVNNANYMHYLEHARHRFLISRNVDFAALHKQGQDLIVTRAELKYRYPLRSDERFVVKISIRRVGNIQIAFDQEIYRLPDNKHILSATIYGACTIDGKPVRPTEVLSALDL